MGEMIGSKENRIKLGTCEDLYYTTFQDLNNSSYKKSETEVYLKNDSGCRFRFPFPDESEVEIGEYEDYSRGFLITIPSDIGVDISHGDIYQHVGFLKGDSIQSDSVSIKLPCPFGKKYEAFDYNMSSKEGKLSFNISQQKRTSYLGSEMLVTIVECPYCGSKSQLDLYEVMLIINYFNAKSEISEENKKYFSETLEVLNIALLGYRLFL